MKEVPPSNDEHGFTLLELLIAMSVFLIICAAMFELLQLSQQRYASENQLSGSFQEARLAVDQIVRDVDVAGYPSLSLYSTIPSDPSTYAAGPVAWSPNYYPATGGCTIGSGVIAGTCTTPGDFDLIVETRLGSDTNVSWVHYYLSGTTLYRAVARKNGGDPLAAFGAPGVAVPFLVNVMNNAAPTQLAQITATYSNMFQGGVAQPIFQYTCETSAGPQPCPTANTSNLPQNISDVDVTLIVATPQRDLQTQMLKLVELNGRGHTSNLPH